MATRILRKLGALLAFGILGSMMMPGCTIRIGQGDATDQDEPWQEDAEPDPSRGGTSDDDAGEVLTPEEIDEMLSQVDQTELALGNARMAYAAYMLSGLTGQQIAILPPSEVDLELFEQLVEQYAPEAFTAADAWLSTTDTSMLLPGRTVKDECYYEPYQCPLRAHCEFAASCLISDCGQAADCSTCPDLFGLAHLASDRWCAYTCLSNAEISGWGIYFHIRPLDTWWLYCHARH